MELALACVYLAYLAIALLVLTIMVCARHAALWRWRRMLLVAACVWLIMAIAKKGYIDEIFPPADGVKHENAAREVAALLDAGRFSEALSRFRAGNPAYQFILGVFYAASGATEVVTYAINGALGFWGLLALLEILCRQTNCVRLPPLVVGIVSLLPSGLLWTTANLKEGPILWGICMMCYWTVPVDRYQGRPPRLLPFLGLLAVGAMRPHIAIAWLMAIGAGAMLSRKRTGLLVASAAGTAASLALLSFAAPAMFEEAVEGGVSTTLSERYDDLSENDSAGGAPIAGSNPLPVVSGLALILFRPWPAEVHQMEALLAGVEVWLLAAFGLLNWWLAREKLSWRLPPELVTYIILLLLMGFFFSYMYNMGLVVRQRLMCFPAVLALYIWPLLATQKVRKAASGLRAPLRRGPWAVTPKPPATQPIHR